MVDYLPCYHLPPAPNPPIGPIVPTLPAVLAVVSRYYAIFPEILKGPRRFQSIAHVRQVCCYLMRRLTRNSLSEIGRELERDHTTVIHGIRQVEERMRVDPDLKSQVAMLLDVFGDDLAEPAHANEKADPDEESVSPDEAARRADDRLRQDRSDPKHRPEIAQERHRQLHSLATAIEGEKRGAA